MGNHHGEKWENAQIRQGRKLVACISRGLLSISVTRILDFNNSVGKNNWKIRDRHVTKVFRYLTTGGPHRRIVITGPWHGMMVWHMKNMIVM